MDAHAVAAELRALAERIERLPAYDRRDPHAFHEGKAALAADVAALADAVTARRDPSPSRMPLAVPPRRRGLPVILFRKAVPA